MNEYFPESFRLLAPIISGQRPLDDIPAADWHRIVNIAVMQRVHPLVFNQVKAAKTAQLDAALCERLRQLMQVMTMRQMMYENQMGYVDTTLRQAGIVPVWFKGLVVAWQAYPPPHLRPMVDLDVLVPFAERERALDALLASGFNLPEQDARIVQHRSNLFTTLRKHYTLERVIYQQHLRVELHFHLIGADSTFFSRSQMATVLEERTEIDIRGKSYHTFNTEMHLVYLCAHAALQHGLAYSDLRMIYDIYSMLCQQPYDMARIADIAHKLNWTPAVDTTFQYISELFDAPELDAKRQQLHPVVANTQHQERVKSLINLQKSQDVHLLVDGMRDLSMRQRLNFGLLLLFPNDDYLKARYGITGQRWQTYPRYWWASIIKYGNSLWQSLLERLTHN